MGSGLSVPLVRHNLDYQAASLTVTFSEPHTLPEESAMEAYTGVDAAVLAAFVGTDAQSPLPPPNEGVALIMEDRTWGVPQRVSHMEVPANRKCQPIFNATQPKCHDGRKCIMCSCILCMRYHQEFLQGYHEAIESLKIKLGGNSLQGTIKEAMAQFAAIVESDPTLRKNLSHWGAVRITKRGAMKVLNSAESLNNYFINLQMEGSEPGYVFSQDMGNYAYAVYFDSLGLGVASHLNVEHRADIVEGFLALGWAYRTRPQDNQFLEPVKWLIPQIEVNIITLMEGPSIPFIAAEEAQNATQKLRDLLRPIIQTQEDVQQNAGVRTEINNIRELILQTQAGMAHVATMVEQGIKAIQVDVRQILREKKEAEKVWAFNVTPPISAEEDAEVQEWAAKHWPQVTAYYIEQIAELKLPKQVAVLNAQSTAYKALKQGTIDMSDSGWAGYQALADYVRDPNNYGDISDYDLMAILAYTLDHHTQQPSYVMKVVESLGTNDNQGKIFKGIVVKIREQSKPNKRTGGYDGGYGSSKAGRYGGYKSQSYGN